MSQENVEIVRRLTEAFNRRDIPAQLALLDDAVEWKEDQRGFTGLQAVYRGHDGYKRWVRQAILETWDAFHFEPDEIVERPDGRVLLVGIATARGKGSGAETRQRFWSVFWLKNGKIFRRQVFLARAEALEAIGLSE
jgi:ketosteroid isomerase-like protein